MANVNYSELAELEDSELASRGLLRVDCPNCKGKGVVTPPKNPAKGEIPCKKCHNGQVYVSVQRVQIGKPVVIRKTKLK